MTSFNAPSYDIERPTGQCAVTGRTLEPGEAYVATLVEVEADTEGKVPPGGLKRLDISAEAWQQGRRPEGVFSHWRSVVPQPNEKKQLFVNDDVLLDLFRRLSDEQDPQRLAFRFVLGLILMRKKVLRFEGSERRAVDREQPGGHQVAESGDPGEAASDGSSDQSGPEIEEWWTLTVRGTGGDGEPERVLMLNPQLDEAGVRQVTDQLGQILHAEL